MTVSLTIVITLALTGGFVGSALSRTFARRYGIVNAPNPLVPQHTIPVAYLGGVGVLTGLGAAWLALFVTRLGEYPAKSIIIPAILYSALGLFDDLRPLEALPKLIAQAAVAVVAVGLGVRVPLTTMAIVNNAITVLWIVTCVNAFNIADVCDGLVTGLAVVIFLAHLLFVPTEQSIAAAGLGACLGFLPFNAPRASIFLGDTGSHLIGFLVATLAVLPGTESPGLRLAQMILFLFVPFFELIFVTFIRLRKGLPWWKGSPDHFSLRLQQAGWSRWRVDLVSWSIMGVTASIGLILPAIGLAGRFAIGALVLITAGRVGQYLLSWDVARKN